jgi:signal transduction histidine kinase
LLSLGNRFVRNVKRADRSSHFAYSDLVRVTFYDRLTPSWQLIAGAVLAALLAALAVLQYRWIGEVGEAERARMRAGLQTRAADFSQEFDRELTRLYLAFHLDPDALDHDLAQTVHDGLDKVQAMPVEAGLVRGVFLLEARGSQDLVLQRFDPSTHTLQAAEWPPALAEWRARASHQRPLGPAAGLPIFMADAVDASAPALIIPVPFIKRVDDGAGHVAVVPNPAAAARSLIVWLDGDRLRQQLLEPLVAKYFGAAQESEYVVSIVQRDEPSHVVYSSASETIDERSADVAVGLFDLRLEEMTRVTGLVNDHTLPAPARVKDRVAITIVRRGSAGDASRALIASAANQGAWQLRARYRSGSLETIVASSRRRNLAITFAILGLLGAAFALVIAASQRQRRLARQQMEFVASVSHELRTPLAVICSAGENLADGVVSDSAQIKTYGTLIETEGRRLGDMVERVLLFAGIGSGTRTSSRSDVDVARVVDDAVSGVSSEARARDVAINVHRAASLPSILGDAEALRSALQNIVGNAVKYSLPGGSVHVALELLHDAIVRIRVADRGIGIDRDDLPHIFQPFYRGRRALDSQVRGTGIGLSVVMHVVRSHGGDVHVDSRSGEGTTVTVVLPAAMPDGRGREVRIRGEQASVVS